MAGPRAHNSAVAPGPADSITLRPRGVARYVGVIFLAVWIAGWAIGEGLALAVLSSMMLSLAGLFRDSRWTEFGRSMLGPSAGFGFVFVFMLVWGTLWTVGGIAACWQFLRLAAGSDTAAIVPEGMRLTRRAGPIRRTTLFERAGIRRVRIRSHDKALVADTTSGTRFLTDLGTVKDREELAAWMRARLNLSSAPATPTDVSIAPPGWQVTRADSGALRLWRPTRSRRIAAAIMWAVTAVVAYASLQSREPAAIGWLLALLSLLVFGSAWLSWAREDWLARTGHLRYELQFGPFLRADDFNHARLELTRSVDSDGDAKYRLTVLNGSRKRTIETTMFDDAELVECARWVEAATGFPLRLQ